MKVLLIHPAYKEYKLTEPLGLCYIGAYLRAHGYEVDFFDPRIDGLNLEGALDYLKARMNSYGLIGITCCDFYHCDLRKTIEGIRENGYKGHITLGGYGPTTDWECFAGLGPDSVITGEGEKTFLRLAEGIKNGNEWRNIPGIAYENPDGTRHRNANCEPVENLDELPFPARDIYFSFAARYGKNLISPQIQGSRGCFMNCSFCSTPDFLSAQGGKPYRMRSIKSIADEIELLYSRHGITDFEFVDDNFFPQDRKQAYERAKELHDEIMGRKMKITFFMQFRPEHISYPMLKLLKMAGMTRMFIGIESINDEDLKLYGRTYGKQQIHDAIKTITRAGYSSKLTAEYRFRYGYINFNPLSTLESLKKSGDFFRKYGLSYKKLAKSLVLFDNKRRIHKKIIDKFPEFSADRYFKNPEVKVFFGKISEYFKKYAFERDKFRVLEKALTKKNRHRILRPGIAFIRWQLDRKAFYCYRKGLNLAGNTGAHDKLDEFFKRQAGFLERRIRKISGFYGWVAKKAGIPAGAKDMFF